MENERLYQILSFCLKENTIIAQSTLAEQFQVSKSTIRLEIDKIEELIKDWDLCILKKRGVGILIDGSDGAKAKAQDMIRDLFQKEHFYEDDELEYGILLYLFQHLNQFVRIYDLANEFYVSESVIAKRLKQVRKKLDDSHIHLKAIQNKGIKICGSEEKVRQFFARLMAAKRERSFQNDIPTNVQDQIMSMLGIDSSALFHAISLCEKELKKAFSDESKNSLAIHIAIAIKRSYQGKSTPCHEFIKRKSYEKEYNAARHLFENIMEQYGIPYSDDEVYYLFLHLISANVVEDEELARSLNLNTRDVVMDIAIDITMLIKDFKQIQVEKTFVDNLVLHLRPMINRLEYGIDLVNPLLKDIKSSFPEAYGIAWMCNTILMHHIGKELSENEAGYIAMHIQAMIESNKKDIRAVIVCSSGIGVSQLLATQIEQHFSRIFIVAVEGLSTFHEHCYGNEIDLVLSTFPVQCKAPALLVNPFLTKDDIQRIHDFISGYRTMEVALPHQMKLKAFLQKDWLSQEEVIQSIAQALLQQQEVTDSFASSIYERERISSTAIGMNVALPHASFDTILTTQVVVVTLNKSIPWGDDDVDIILFTLVTTRDIEWANAELKKIYRKLYSATFHKELLRINNESEMIQKLL